MGRERLSSGRIVATHFRVYSGAARGLLGDSEPQTSDAPGFGRRRAIVSVRYNLWQGAAPVEPSQLPTGTDAEEDSRPTSDCEANTAAEGCANSHQAAGAAGSSTSAAIVAAQVCKTPRGRMAVLEKTLAAENATRAELLKEEHTVRVRLLQEDHDYMMLERVEKRKH
ncbi:hypothetical protein HPB51_004635 [Rhipicephalus microplus]|uniref:Uncharacterized protein n=1 Tax=Rhipicephalus microplus TaxID=6941 RepID=A0A9J6DYN0_RHIMP|nr:hypothetical protein HPB51_004635 [Rhipicephalus microplus]